VVLEVAGMVGLENKPFLDEIVDLDGSVTGTTLEKEKRFMMVLAEF
jgi:hypothetical protein